MAIPDLYRIHKRYVYIFKGDSGPIPGWYRTHTGFTNACFFILTGDTGPIPDSYLHVHVLFKQRFVQFCSEACLLRGCGA